VSPHLTVAADLGVRERHLRRVFREAVGVSPVATKLRPRNGEEAALSGPPQALVARKRYPTWTTAFTVPIEVRVA
jgi:hypothetical protein